MFKSKKFVGMIIGVSVLTAILILCAIFAPAALTEKTVTAGIIGIVLLIVIYTGGNAFVKWAISKYFNKDLAEE